MSMTLHFHPLSSFCWKALVGLYELEIPFEKHLVDLSKETARADFARLWPIAKFPVLRDDARNRTVPESTIILEYIDGVSHGGARLIPADPERALECRLRDRIFDLYVHLPMQKIVGDKLRGAGQQDPTGVEAARATLTTAYATLERRLDGEWADGEAFSLADCAAYPALYYANRVQPISAAHLKTHGYLARLRGRPSVQRVMEEAEPYLHLFPG